MTLGNSTITTDETDLDIITNYITIVVYLCAVWTNLLVLRMTFNVKTQSSTVAFIRNLAINELLICLDCLRKKIQLIIFPHFFSHYPLGWLCKVLKFNQWVTNTSFIYLYSCITADRACAIVLPSFYRCHHAAWANRVSLAVLAAIALVISPILYYRCHHAAWANRVSLAVLAAIALVISPILYYRVLREGECMLLPEAAVWEWITIKLVRLAIPTAIICLCSGYIVSRVWLGERRIRLSESEGRLTAIVVTLALSTVIMIISSNVAAHVWLRHDPPRPDAVHVFSDVCYIIQALNSMVNLLLYSLSPTFREALSRTLPCLAGPTPAHSPEEEQDAEV